MPSLLRGEERRAPGRGSDAEHRYQEQSLWILCVALRLGGEWGGLNREEKKSPKVIEGLMMQSAGEGIATQSIATRRKQEKRLSMAGFSKSRFAAYLQNIVSKRRYEVGLYAEIAEALQLPSTGCILDVGTGSGLQLKVIHENRPQLELYGIDLSEAAIRVAMRNLAGLEVDLRVESIESTSHEDDFFDLVTCNASMSYWKNPITCFDEIFRILRPGGVARLFEPQKEVDIQEVGRIIDANLANESRLRRFAAVSLNKFGLRWGRSIGLRLYSIGELLEIAHRSKFGQDVSIEKVTFQNLPIFVQIILMKVCQPESKAGEA